MLHLNYGGGPSFAYASGNMDEDSRSERTTSTGGMDVDSTRGCSPAPSAYSFHSSVDGHTLREVHGRLFNGNNEIYMLPADTPEHGRLGLQHNALFLAINSLYQARERVQAVLAPRPGYHPAIIDVGCGAGTWTLAMAHEFPHCEVVGVDLAPPRIADVVPTNCRFECDDANLGFEHYIGKFDVVHLRSISPGIQDYPYLLRECTKMLRPGGVILFVDGDLQLYDDKFKSLPACEEGEKKHSWLQKIFFETYSSMKNRGASVDGSFMTPRWLRDVPELENVGAQDVFIPVGPWLKGSPRVELMSELMRRDALLVTRGMRPLLLSEGYFESTIDRYIKEVEVELSQLKRKIYSIWHFGWATKRFDIPQSVASSSAQPEDVEEDESDSEEEEEEEVPAFDAEGNPVKRPSEDGDESDEDEYVLAPEDPNAFIIPPPPTYDRAVALGPPEYTYSPDGEPIPILPREIENIPTLSQCEYIDPDHLLHQNPNGAHVCNIAVPHAPSMYALAYEAEKVHKKKKKSKRKPKPKEGEQAQDDQQPADPKGKGREKAGRKKAKPGQGSSATGSGSASAGGDAEMEMDPDHVEASEHRGDYMSFVKYSAAAHYDDGSLPPEQRAAIEARMRADQILGDSQPEIAPSAPAPTPISHLSQTSNPYGDPPANPYGDPPANPYGEPFNGRRQPFRPFADLENAAAQAKGNGTPPANGAQVPEEERQEPKNQYPHPSRPHYHQSRLQHLQQMLMEAAPEEGSLAWRSEHWKNSNHPMLHPPQLNETQALNLSGPLEQQRSQMNCQSGTYARHPNTSGSSGKTNPPPQFSDARLMKEWREAQEWEKKQRQPYTMDESALAPREPTPQPSVQIRVQPPPPPTQSTNPYAPNYVPEGQPPQHQQTHPQPVHRSDSASIHPLMAARLAEQQELEQLRQRQAALQQSHAQAGLQWQQGHHVANGLPPQPTVIPSQAYPQQHQHHANGYQMQSGFVPSNGQQYAQNGFAGQGLHYEQHQQQQMFQHQQHHHQVQQQQPHFAIHQFDTHHHPHPQAQQFMQQHPHHQLQNSALGQYHESFVERSHTPTAIAVGGGVGVAYDPLDHYQAGAEYDRSEAYAEQVQFELYQQPEAHFGQHQHDAVHNVELGHGLGGAAAEVGAVGGEYNPFLDPRFVGQDHQFASSGAGSSGVNNYYDGYSATPSNRSGPHYQQ